MELGDFGRHRKALMVTTAVGFVLAASGEQEMYWAGITLSGTWVWIFVGIAHAYFMLMFWACYGMREMTTQNISSVISYAGGGREKVGKPFTYNVPFSLGILGALNIVAHLLIILDKTIKGA